MQPSPSPPMSEQAKPEVAADEASSSRLSSTDSPVLQPFVPPAASAGMSLMGEQQPTTMLSLSPLLNAPTTMLSLHLSLPQIKSMR